uniref:Uncharacterized protein n=1 Tax=Molossus molossus TaxID=27622 RepID=A0A7J8HKQ4_MOLMO|nr:hypothetical protein HJG59_019875 [Molossus molossus]
MPPATWKGPTQLCCHIRSIPASAHTELLTSPQPRSRPVTFGRHHRARRESSSRQFSSHHVGSLLCLPVDKVVQIQIHGPRIKFLTYKFAYTHLMKHRIKNTFIT